MLLDRLEALVALAAKRRGLVLTATGALARAEALTVASVAGLPRAAATTGEVALLTAVAVAVGLLRVRGQRLEVTSLRAPWSRIAPNLRAGIIYAAWCHRMPWPSVLGADPAIGRLHAGRLRVLHLLHALPPAVDINVPALTRTLIPALEDEDPWVAGEGAEDAGVGAVGKGAGVWGQVDAGVAGEARASVPDPGAEAAGALPPGSDLVACLAAAFLAPLGALGVAELEPAPPATPLRMRLLPEARTVVASALLAAGEEVPVEPLSEN